MRVYMKHAFVPCWDDAQYIFLQSETQDKGVTC